MDNRAPEILKSSLLAGGVFGIAGGLPLLGYLNCACCSLMVGSGFMAAWLYSRECSRRGAAFHAGGGAWVGLVSGLFYTLAAMIVTGLQRLLGGAPDPDEVAEAMETLEQGLQQFGVTAEQLDAAAAWAERMQGPMGIVLGFCVTLLLAAVFSTVGGLIGGAVFKVEPPPASPPGSPSNAPGPQRSEPSGP
jgi:hypothetical protein